MPDMDVGKALRLQGAIRAGLEAIPTDQAAVAGTAMAQTYHSMRKEVWISIPNARHDEFQRLFPESLGPFTHVSGPLHAEAAKFNQARGLLGQLAGWLNDYVELAKMEKVAQAAANARMKEERGVGFKGPDKP